MTKEQILKRASNAKFVLENPAYIEALAKITQDIRSLRLQLSPRDAEGASRLVFMEQSVERAKRIMEVYLFDGEAAKKELESEVRQTPMGRLTNRFRRMTSVA